MDGLVLSVDTNWLERGIGGDGFVGCREFGFDEGFCLSARSCGQ